MNTKASPYSTGPFEFLNIVNFDFETPGSLTKRDGSTQYLGATVAGRVGGGYEFTRLSGFSQLIGTANTNAYFITVSAFNSFRSGLLNNGTFDFVTFVDRLFMANGQNFIVYDGSAARSFSLPPGTTLASSLTGTATGFTGLYTYSYGYLNDRGYFGPGGPLTSVSVNEKAVVLTGFTTPIDYGITAIVIYRSDANLTDLFEIAEIPAGSSLYVDNDVDLGTNPLNDNLWFTLAPSYLEIDQNRLFMAGFSSALSTFYFSEVGEPEGVLPESSIEVRTNDGDKITGLRAYNGNLVVTKEKSFHVLTGDNPDNFLLTQVSDQYGCLSNRAIVQFESYLWFLDRKGIVEFNGAQTSIVSNKVEPIFTSMNVDAAKTEALGVHHKAKNQLIFFIPCNGATFNNCAVVYDYLVQAWTTFSGINVSSAWLAKAGFSAERLFYGTYSGAICSFGSSLFGDNGQSMTCLIKTRFFSELGKSTTEQYRRFFIDLDPVTGMTSPLNINFYTDYGSSVQLTRTMYQAPFQSRIDFGLPAKSLAAEISNTTNTDPIKIHGFTIESRLQRQV